MYDLTSREQQVFSLLMEGKKTNDIAEELEVRKNTIKFHTKRIYKKLGVNSKSELLVRYLK